MCPQNGENRRKISPGSFPKIRDPDEIFHEFFIISSFRDSEGNGKASRLSVSVRNVCFPVILLYAETTSKT